MAILTLCTEGRLHLSWGLPGSSRRSHPGPPVPTGRPWHHGRGPHSFLSNTLRSTTVVTGDHRTFHGRGPRRRVRHGGGFGVTWLPGTVPRAYNVNVYGFDSDPVRSANGLRCHGPSRPVGPVPDTPDDTSTRPVIGWWDGGRGRVIPSLRSPDVGTGRSRRRSHPRTMTRRTTWSTRPP